MYVGKVIGSLLSPNCVIAKDIKSCTFCCYVRCLTSKIWVEADALAKNRRNSLPVWTESVHSNGWLSAICSVVKIYGGDMGLGTSAERLVWSILERSLWLSSSRKYHNTLLKHNNILFYYELNICIICRILAFVVSKVCRFDWFVFYCLSHLA